MPGRPAARPLDQVTHPLPKVLMPGPGSLNVIIGYKPCWRGIPLAAAAGIIATNAAANAAAAGGPIAAAAAVVTASTAIMSAKGMADVHVCLTPAPPHGPGVVIDGSATVQVNFLPPARMGDKVLEASGPPNPIMSGCNSCLIGP